MIMSSDFHIDWAKLPFGYYKTDYNVRFYYKNGQWSEMEISDSEYLTIHMSATALHYAQEAFEGLKAFRGKKGEIRFFRWKDNAERMRTSARGLFMPEISDEMFFKAIKNAVLLNEKYIPPYGTGASLYIRPLLFGSGPEIGVKPSKEYIFIVFVMPVGPYFKEGLSPVKILLERSSDRAAPLGTGSIKVGGNYASSIRGVMRALENGCVSPMYLDPKEKKYIDEIGAANFFGIKNNTYITPASPSILPSITNKSLMEIAKKLGMKVEQRPIMLEELETFEEIGACGTAAIISSIGVIIDIEKNKEYHFCRDGKPGPLSTKLYNYLVGIQYGDIDDDFNWVTILEK